MYNFGIIAWEVRTDSFVRGLSVRSLEIGSDGVTPVF